MLKTIHEAISLQSLFRQSNLMIHLTKDSAGPQLTESSLAAQQALAKILLEVEKIQRAEASENCDSAAVHNDLRFAPTSIVPTTHYRLEA